MTDGELKALVAENSIAIRESQKRMEASEMRWQEEMLASRREADRALTSVEKSITSLRREVGRLGNSLGGYVEDMFRPSLQRVLREQFGMTTLLSPFHLEMDGEVLEIDMVGHAGEKSDEVYLVEIKSHLRPRTLEQLHRHLRRFPHFLPEHRGKKLFGIVAALRIPDELRAQSLEDGFYLATIKDDVFQIVSPDGFEPQTFGLRGLA